MQKNNLKILIVEDDMIYAIRLKHWLSNLNIYDITLVESAEGGQEYLDKMIPHIVFLDKSLPNLSGTDVIKSYKASSPESTVILMSSSYNIEGVALGIQEGADYLFDKNITTEKDIAKIVDAVIQAKKKNKSIWKILSIFSNAPTQKSYRKIAIVEDDELFSFHMGWVLEKNTRKKKIETYSDAESFFFSYDFEIPDLVFLDYSLPDTNGDAILKFIKEKSPNTAVVMISAQDSPKIALELKALGVEKYIIKDENWIKNLKAVITALDI